MSWHRCSGNETSVGDGNDKNGGNNEIVEENDHENFYRNAEDVLKPFPEEFRNTIF